MRSLNPTPGLLHVPQGRELDFQIVGGCLLAAVAIATYPIAYLCIVVPAILPLYQWLRAGAPGIPTLPIVAGLSVIYYAAPALRGDLPTDDINLILSASLIVAGFLASAAVVYQFFLIAAARRQRRRSNSSSDHDLVAELTVLGLGSGIAFYLAVFAGWFEGFGSYVGIVRAIALTFASIGCYLAGAARADGVLRGPTWLVTVICIISLALVSVGSLLLVGGIVNVVATVLGYVIAKRRVPWITLVLIFAVISVLQAGKPTIRDKYWDADQEVSPSQIPAIMAEWFGSGVDVLWSGEQQVDVLERASLLWTVIRVREMTPEAVPYLGGESYALLPAYLVPRFIDPNKPKSQTGLNLLAVRYGFQTEEGTERTTIAFGVIAEAFANFGNWGLLSVGAVFGALCGIITWFSAGLPLLSVRMFVAIAATTVLLNVEADFAYLIVTMLQAVGAVLIAATVPVLAKSVFNAKPSVAAISPTTRRITTAAE